MFSGIDRGRPEHGGRVFHLCGGCSAHPGTAGTVGERTHAVDLRGAPLDEVLQVARRVLEDLVEEDRRLLVDEHGQTGRGAVSGDEVRESHDSRVQG
jgi:hypothetical protein